MVELVSASFSEGEVNSPFDDSQPSSIENTTCISHRGDGSSDIQNEAYPMPKIKKSIKTIVTLKPANLLR
jgi:hypothetical protein